MRAFAALFARLDGTTSTNAKVAAMKAYFQQAPPEDAAWAVHFLSGGKLKRLIPIRRLQEWCLELTGLSPWLFEESYSACGDLAETIALLTDGLPHEKSEPIPLHLWVLDRLEPLRELEPDAQKERVIQWWRQLDRQESFLLDKMLTGGLRVGVSQTLVTRAIAEAYALERAVVAHRLMGSWEPTAESFQELIGEKQPGEDASRPYPFFLASPLDGGPESLGERDGWLAEWKWDGIRAQLVRRRGGTFLWSRGEELVTKRYPEVVEAAGALPEGTVLDGELLAFEGEGPLPFAMLQRRIGRKKPGPKILAEVPVRFLAYDLLEDDGDDIRELPLKERRRRLESLIPGGTIGISEVVTADSWTALAEWREQARERSVEGLMLKDLESQYGFGRVRGPWWKWKVEPFHIDAVMIYAQAGHGRRASLHTDYTFAVWDGDALVPIAKAYSGLDQKEIEELDRWIRRHTRERFGPVRSVDPVHVFELSFEGIQVSKRHKAGLAVRFPRIERWRRDKPVAEADTLESLRRLAEAHG